jgi:RNA polymerase sigma-70 factor (ECF subfamily)
MELVARIQGGDQQAFAVLLDRYQGKVQRMIRRMWSRDQQLVEDLVQDVFLRVFRGLPGFAGECSLGAWIHRIAVNVCISEIRQRRALKRDRLTLSLDAPIGGHDGKDPLYLDPPAPQVDPGEPSERDELYRQCRQAIADLPELWRVILTLRDLEGRSYEEIAEILKLPIGTVRSRLHRARARVRKAIDGGAA